MERNFPIILLLFLISCELSSYRIAVDAQVVDEAKITQSQTKSIYRESQDLPDNTQISIAIIEGGQTKIFSKYQMTNSTTDRKKVNDKLVRGLNAKGNEIPNWDLNVLAGAGGVLSSVSDLSKFAIAQFDETNEVLKLTRKSTFDDYQMNIGLGWIIKAKSGNKRFWHNGGTGGYTSCMQVDIENRNAVIVLSNVSGISRKRVNIESLCNRLMDSLN